MPLTFPLPAALPVGPFLNNPMVKPSVFFASNFCVCLALAVEALRIHSGNTLKKTDVKIDLLPNVYSNIFYRNIFVVSSMTTGVLGGLALYKGKKKVGYTAVCLAIGQGLVSYLFHTTLSISSQEPEVLQSGVYKTMVETDWSKESGVALLSYSMGMVSTVVLPFFGRYAESGLNKGLNFLYHRFF